MQGTREAHGGGKEAGCVAEKRELKAAGIMWVFKYAIHSCVVADLPLSMRHKSKKKGMYVCLLLLVHHNRPLIYDTV